MLGRNAIGSMRGVESEFIIPRSYPNESKSEINNSFKENGPNSQVNSLAEDLDDLIHRF